MATSTGKTKTDAGEALKHLTYLAAALKAPRITEAAARLADHARDAGWTHEEYLAAVLDREVAVRNASGAQLRIRAERRALGGLHVGEAAPIRGDRPPVHVALVRGDVVAQGLRTEGRCVRGYTRRGPLWPRRGLVLADRRPHMIICRVGRRRSCRVCRSGPEWRC